MRASRSVATYLTTLAFVGAACALATYLSLFLIPPGTTVALLWPAAALGMAALFLFGVDVWPALLLSLFFVMLAHSASPLEAAGHAFGNTLEALVGVWILRRFEFDAMLWRLQDALVLILAAAVASIVSTTALAATTGLFGHAGLDGRAATELLIEHLVSIISFTPFLLRWGYKPRFSRTRNEWIEGLVGFGAFVGICVLLFWTPFTSVGPISLFYVAVIPLVWAALRTGPRGISLAIFILALIASTGALFGAGDLFGKADVFQVIFSIQLVIGMVSMIFLLFVSIVEERKEAVKSMEGHVEKLEEALEKIRTEDQAKTDFIAILAHELRNPLSPLLSGLELLKIQGGASSDILQMMGAHLHTMARLLDDLLDISRISQKKFKVQRQPVKLDAIMSQTIEMVQPYIDERKHALAVSLPAQTLWINGDPVRLTQIFVNLLSNAAKYTPPGGSIRLEAAARDGELVVTVTDTGIGIAPDRIKKIFEPFGAGDAARGTQGLHIGLSLAKRMAEIHHGSIDVSRAEVGHGSTFTVRLPLMPTPPLPLQDTEAPGRRSRFSRERLERVKTRGALEVLVVDDNEAAAASMAKLLEHNGHRARLAYDAPQALELVEGYTPDVALLDIGLPTMDGYELCQRLRERFGERVMLVALTGFGQAEDKEKARAAGFDEHLTKPVSIIDVERVLAEYGRHG